MKLNLKMSLVCLFFMTSVTVVYSDSNIIDFKQLVLNRFHTLWTKFPQEKVYIQTDKPYYNAGEDIWFKGYVVNANTLTPTPLSQFLYVELIDKFDSVVSRVKIRKDSLGFSGKIPLMPEIQAGIFAIRAYTYYMQNLSSDFFFVKNIYIGNSIDDRVDCQISYGKISDKNVPIYLEFKNTFHTPLVNRKVKVVYTGKKGSPKSIVVQTDEKGFANFTLPNDTNIASKKYFDVEISEQDIKFKRKFSLPNLKNDYDVQFFPESGALLSNELQTVAFKAIGNNGLSIDISGKIFDSKNNEIANFSSIHNGMGRFMILPSENESYYAKVRSRNGFEKQFDLPTCHSNGVSLKIIRNKGKIGYNVMNHTLLPITDLWLIVYSGSVPYLVHKISKSEGLISESIFPSGVFSFAIVDSLSNIYCERLLFIEKNDQPVISMKSDKIVYGKRERVNLDFNIQSVTGEPVDGTYSISVTDSRTVNKDSVGNDILSYLLLSSDIKGYVEEPGSYFSQNGLVNNERLDILLLTQGWRRFELSNVLKGDFQPQKYYIEAGQALSGKVKNVLGKPNKKSEVFMLTQYKNQIKMTETDSLGNYLIDGIEFPDSTVFILKAKKHKNLSDVQIIPDKDVFPSIDLFIPDSVHDNIIPPEDYFFQTKEKYYNDGGMLVMNLKELTVVAEKKGTGSDNNDIYAGMADTQIDAEKLEKYSNMSILNVLSTLPGVIVMGETVSIRGNSKSPLFLIDGMETEDIQDLSFFTASDVESISVFKGASAAIFGFRGGNGVISITLKKGADIRRSLPPPSLAVVKPFGYQKPVEFYTPKYDVDSVLKNPKPDLRTTIYWNPKLVADSIGNVHVEFYTADKMSDYNIVFEGITNKGEICRFKGVVRREGY